MWATALRRYSTPRTLRTRARDNQFTVAARDGWLAITPATGRPRRVFEAEFVAAVSLIGSASRQDLQAVTFNSSYLEAIVADLKRGG